ncbi:hypothetical protein LJC48_02230 [Desulfovibrio sp. OttesenSCG-928-C06]|nr:hypothetical protein [Desulfovibrio sp. OttesenSCG-928-C06]
MPDATGSQRGPEGAGPQHAVADGREVDPPQHTGTGEQSHPDSANRSGSGDSAQPDAQAKGQQQSATDWSSRSLAGKWRHRFFYLFLRVFGVKAAKIPLFFVVCGYVLVPSVAGRATHYLERRFPELLEQPCLRARLTRLRHTFRLYWSFACVLLERAAAGILGRCSVAPDPDCLAKITELLGKGKGLIILSAHVGAWQTALAGLRFGPRVNILQPRDGQDIDLHVFEHAGADATAESGRTVEAVGSISSGGIAGTGITGDAASTASTASVEKDCPEQAYRIIDPLGGFGGLVEASAALRNGEILCIMGDRLMPAESLRLQTEFLGHPAVFPGSAYLLAAMTEAPVAVVFSRRTGECRAECSCYASFDVPRKAGKKADSAAPYAGIFASALERYCKLEPYQFFNFHSIWKIEGDNDA